MKQTRPERFVFNPAQASDEAKDLLALVDQYRVLSGLTWHDFCYIGFAKIIEEDNADLANLIYVYIKNRRRPGRPAGSSLKSKMQAMGVNPYTYQNKHISK